MKWFSDAIFTSRTSSVFCYDQCEKSSIKRIPFSRLQFRVRFDNEINVSSHGYLVCQWHFRFAVLSESLLISIAFKSKGPRGKLDMLHTIYQRLTPPRTARWHTARNFMRTVCQRSSSNFLRSPDLRKREIKHRVNLEHRDIHDGDGVCAAYCVNYPVLLPEVVRAMTTLSFTARKKNASLAFKPKDFQVFSGDVLHLPMEASEGTTMHHGHAFFFRSGAAVFWGLPADLRRQLFTELAKHQEYEPPNSLSRNRVQKRRNVKLTMKMEDFDHEFGYAIDPKLLQPSFRDDQINLLDFSDRDALLAFSYGLAQSVKLSIYEEQIDLLIQRTRSLPDELARDGKIRLSHRELKGLIGELLAARYSVNLVSDILDTPEYFWQHPELQNLHMECATEIELRQRARILDTRTNVIKDALDLLNSELSSSSSDRVERAILFLIAVEVSLEFARLLPLAMHR